MITDDYVNFEIAKLLKERGFNEPCYAIWYDDRIVLLAHLIDNDSLLLTDEYKFSIQKESLITIPTHQMACAWLREIHHTFIEIGTSIDLNGNYHFSYTILNKECKYVRRGYTDFDWHYEDAVEAAIKYCLENLI